MCHVTRLSTILMGMLVGLSSSLYAQDAVVLIDQTRVMAGNITPGDAPGFPATISRSGSYRLASNLVISPAGATAIQITASNVTLDLNGFSIVGPGGCSVDSQGLTSCPAPGSGVGVLAGDDLHPGARSITVRNGSVRGMTLTGIQITGDGSMVENVASDGNYQDGFNVNGLVSESSATGNGLDGILGQTIRNSTATANRRVGISVRTLGGVATGNVSTRNGGHGITAALSTIRGNVASLNSDVGISILCPSVVSENTAIDNGHGDLQTSNSGCATVNNATF